MLTKAVSVQLIYNILFISDEHLTEGKARQSDIEESEPAIENEEDPLSGSEYKVTEHESGDESETDAAVEEGEDDDLYKLELNSVSAIKAAWSLVSCDVPILCR